MEDKNLANNYTKKFYKFITEIENILEYSLFLPRIKPVRSTSEEDWVSEAVRQCYENCYNNLFSQIGNSFFGGDNIIKIDGQNEYFKLLDNYNKKFKSMKGFECCQYNFFAKSLLSHCIMASYDTTFRLLPFDNITSYALTKIENRGLQELQDRKQIDISKGKVCTEKNQGINEETGEQIGGVNDRSGDASNLSDKIDSHSSLYELESFKTFFDFDEDNHIKLVFADILYSLLQVYGTTFEAFIKLYKSDRDMDYHGSHTHKDWNLFCRVYEKLYSEKTLKDIFPNNADRLYYYYKLENTFGLSLANEIFQNVRSLKKEKKPYPDGINDIKLLSGINCFPNVFSRNIYLKHAFAYIRDEWSVYDSYLLRPTSSNAGMDLQRYRAYEFNYNEWALALDRFCKFYNKLIFPAIEWYFFLILKKTVDKHIAAPEDRIPKLNKLLAIYINDNAEHLEYPLGDTFPTYTLAENNEFSKEEPDIAILLSFFNSAKSHKTFPLSYLNKEFLVPKKGKSEAEENAYTIRYRELIQNYIKSVIDA